MSTSKASAASWVCHLAALLVVIGCRPVESESKADGGACTDPKTGVDLCPSGNRCTRFIRDGEEISACQKLCDPLDPAGCDSSRVCSPYLGQPDLGSCREKCRDSDDDCRSGLTCETSSGLCTCSSDSACKTAFNNTTASCGSTRTCTLSCAGSNECTCGSVCVSGGCTAGCKSDSDCCGQGTCSAGRCTLGAVSSLGGRCAYDTHCQTGLRCHVNFERGACLPLPTGTGCTANACPAGTTCVMKLGSNGAFYPTCRLSCTQANDACNAGTSCAAVPTDPTTGTCQPSCHDSTGCPNGLECDLGSGLCTCAGDAECKAPYGPNATCTGSTCVCNPSCAGKTCGSDGCGGTCGSCSPGTACSPSGVCAAPFCGAGNFVVSCPSGECPNNSHCGSGSSCDCDSGFVAKSCGGTICTGQCDYPDWWCQPCTPSCSGRSCGSNGCGGTCGSCAAGTSCNASGQCAGTTTTTQSCTPSCVGRVCGSNGCGGSCGTCSSGKACTASGQCVSTTTSCTPSCSGRVCGSNGCGGSCGTCASGKACTSTGQCSTSTCTPSCSGRTCGSNGCGGSCGTCSSGKTCSSSGQCVTSTTTCHIMTQCASMAVMHPTGAGHCTGEITGKITNSCGQSIQCKYCVSSGGTKSSCGSSNISSGATVGGELGGIWSCGHSSSATYVYVCAAKDDPYSCIDFK